jgi:hypothetical protein
MAGFLPIEESLLAALQQRREIESSDDFAGII